MDFVMPDFRPAAPELFIAAMALFSLMASTFLKKRARSAAFWLSQVTLLGALVSLLGVLLLILSGHAAQRSLTFSGMYVTDIFGIALKAVILLAVMAVLQYGRAYMAERRLDSPEYYLLVQLSTLGMLVLVSAAHLVTIYLGLELMSLALYALVAIDRDSPRSTEAGMKYFVLGALASGLLLYGMSMLYGATGTLEIPLIARRLYEHGAKDAVVIFSLVFLLAGIGFKLGLVPFHMWVPDVYQGAPTAVTLFVASAPKVAGFAMAMRLLVFGLLDAAEQWQQMLIVLAVASIVLGNFAALAQTNIKRMLAYSGISHMGFVLLGLLSGVVRVGSIADTAVNAYSSAMFYVIAYVLMTLAAFGSVILLSRSGFEAEEIDDFKGLNERSPWFAAMMLITMFSMAGIPFFVGFWAKLSVLQAVVITGRYWLAVLAVLMSVVGAYYYLRIVKLMYFDAARDTSAISAPTGTRILLSVNALLIALIGLRPDGLLQICVFTLRH